jgi:hypothetical protein
MLVSFIVFFWLYAITSGRLMILNALALPRGTGKPVGSAYWAWDGRERSSDEGVFNLLCTTGLTVESGVLYSDRAV